MNLNISGHHLDLTAPLRDYVQLKMQRVERHFDKMLDAHVVLTVEKQRHKAEATVPACGGHLHAEAVEGDMYAAIDQLIDRLDRQTRKFKEQSRDHHAKEAQKHVFEQ